MYALVTMWQVPEALCDEGRTQLEDGVFPFVQQLPGFVETYWTYQHSSGKSLGFTLLNTAEHALDLKYAIESEMEAQTNPAIQLEMSMVHKIVAHVQVESTTAARV